MATEYRIPVTVELNQKNDNDPVKKSQNLAQSAIPTDEGIDGTKAIIGTIQGVNRIMHIGNKLLSASGNTQFSSSVRAIGKIASISVTAISGNYAMAAAQAALELAQVGLQEIQKIKAEAQADNQTQLNNLRLGRTIIGAGYQTSNKNIWGKVTYSVN